MTSPASLPPAETAAPDSAVPPHLDPRVDGLAVTRQRRGIALPQFLSGATGVHSTVNGEAPRRGLASAVMAPVHTPRRIGVVGLKGGVGKTTASVLLANTFARHRHDPVLLFDADTTFGSLALRTGVPVRTSAHELSRVVTHHDLESIAGYLGRSPGGVWVLPSGTSPAQSAGLDETTYIGAMNAVHRHFPIMITDCGAGLAGRLMRRVLSGCHALIIATTPSVDGILATHNALRWLEHIGFTALARNSVVSLTNVPRRNLAVDLGETKKRLAPLCKDVLTIPADPHLAIGTFLDLDALAAPTKQAAMALAATVLTAALSA